jgi:hypothetical protein
MGGAEGHIAGARAPAGSRARRDAHDRARRRSHDSYLRGRGRRRAPAAAVRGSERAGHDRHPGGCRPARRRHRPSSAHRHQFGGLQALPRARSRVRGARGAGAVQGDALERGRSRGADPRRARQPGAVRHARRVARPRPRLPSRGVRPLRRRGRDDLLRVLAEPVRWRPGCARAGDRDAALVGPGVHRRGSASTGFSTARDALRARGAPAGVRTAPPCRPPCSPR